MSDYFDDYINIFKRICIEIDNFDFNCSNVFSFKIDYFEDEYHNKLAAYNICKRLNETYIHTNIKSKLSIIDNTKIIACRVRKDLFIKRIISNIQNKIKSHYVNNKAA